jgi:hypothetical protein
MVVGVRGVWNLDVPGFQHLPIFDSWLKKNIVQPVTTPDPTKGSAYFVGGASCCWIYRAESVYPASLGGFYLGFAFIGIEITADDGRVFTGNSPYPTAQLISLGCVLS